jgi:hypothetical protein
MKPDAPRLFEPDVAAELQAIHQRPHRTHDTAIYGTGEAGELSVGIDGTQTSFRIVPARCELELRQALAKRGTTPLVLLVDYDTELPLDVQGRLAGGQVFFIDSSHRLSRLFGVAAASSELLTSPLARVLLEQSDVSTVRVPGPTLDLATAWRAFLKLRAGFPQDGAFSEDRVVAFCAGVAGGPDFAKVLDRWPGLAEALYAHIETASGPIARLAGVSLAEVISPAILIASDNLAARCAAEGHVDNEVEITAFPRPPWWDLELPAEPTRLAAVVAPSPKPSKPTAQIPMDFVQDKTPPAASPVAELLLASVVFKSLHGDLRRELREEIVPRVDALAGHGGQMPEEVFANSAGIAPWRVGGAVARMAELLNLDGYEVVAHDKAGRQVRLNLKLLEELFGSAQ